MVGLGARGSPNPLHLQFSFGSTKSSNCFLLLFSADKNCRSSPTRVLQELSLIAAEEALRKDYAPNVFNLRD